MTRTVNQATALDAAVGSYEALVTVGGITDRVHFRSGTPLGNDDALLPLALEPSMRVGGVLDLPRGLSPSMRSSCSEIQGLLANWSGKGRVPQFERLEILTSDLPSQPTEGTRGVGAFFTSGVDSTYTALKHHDEITHLIFVDRYDIPQASPAAREAMLAFVRSSAARLDKPLVEVETNLRDFSDRWLTWEFYHGAALATVALLLSQELFKVYIPSTFELSFMVPWGSHPSLDPLWGTDSVAIIHDGSEADRLRKILAIAEHPGALSRLRVCWEHPGDTEESQNCGACEKCTRTMLSLWRCGLLESATSFPDHLNLDAVAHARLHVPAVRSQYREALAHAIRLRDPALSWALARALVTSELAEGLSGTKRQLRRSATMRRLAGRLRGRRSGPGSHAGGAGSSGMTSSPAQNEEAPPS